MKAHLAAALLGVTAAPLAAGAPPPPDAGIEVATAGPQGPLKGTLIAPGDGAPVVLIIPGSGPTDRDGNNPLGVRAAPYRLLAEGLAELGIGSLRIDKRGMFGSAGAVADANAVTVADYAADVTGWIAFLRERTGVGCVWLAGHSEGGLIALVAAQAPQAGVCGIALIAAPGRPLGTVLREQLRANPANAALLPSAEAAIEALERGERVDTSAMHPALQGLFAAPVQGYLIDLFAHDPASLAAASDLPLLLLFGDRDLQTGPSDFEALAAARPDARATMLPGVNHVLKQVDGEGAAANLATYADPSLPLAPGVVDELVGFVTSDEP